MRAEELLAHAGWVRALARELISDQSRVDDIVQQTWLAALERRPRRLVHPRAWLAGVIRNLVRESSRSEARRQRREERSAQPEHLPSTEDLVEKAELQKRVVQAVLDLAEPYRSSLLLRYFEGLSAEDIARQTGTPSSTIRNRLKRGLALMRERFEREQRGDKRPWHASLALLVGGEGAQWVSPGNTAPVTTGMFDMKAITLVAAAALLTAGGASWVVWNTLGGDPQPPVGAAVQQRIATTIAAGEVAPSPPSRDPVGTPYRIRGRIADAAGRPIESARLFVGALPQPFSGDPSHGLAVDGSSFREFDGSQDRWRDLGEDVLARKGVVLGQMFATGVDGTYEVDLPAPGRVFVAAVSSPGIRAEPSGRWTEAPAAGLDFTVQRIGLAHLTVSVVDRANGTLLDEFRGTISGLGPQPRHWSAAAKKFQDAIELPEGAANVLVEVTEPAWARASRQIHLEGGSDETIEFSAHSGTGVAGRVLDADGVPVGNALVFWGDQWRMRRDSFYNSYDPGQIFDGVRTDDRGDYRLVGEAARLTVWHPDYSPQTVKADLAGSVQLSSRGGIRGRLVDDDGLPRAGAVVVLDRKRRAVADFEGRFSFGGVEAGVHGIGSEGLSLDHLLLSVSPGEVLDIGESLPFQRVHVELQSGGQPFTEALAGSIIGVAPVSTQHEFRSTDGAFTVKRILPGRYVALDSRGRLAAFTVESEAAVADVGTAALEIRTALPARIYVVPAGTSDAVHLFCRKTGEERDPATRVVLSPLPPGRYRLGIVGRGIVEEIDLDAEDLVVTLH